MKPYYEDEAVTLYCGDSRVLIPQVLPHGVDHVITDPPFDTRTHKKADIGFRGYHHRIEFDPLDVAAVVPALLEVSRRWVVAFCSMEMFGAYRDASGEAWVRAGFWRKPNGAPQFTGDRPGTPGEGVAVMHRPGKKRWNGGGRHGIWDCATRTDDRIHPTAKPVPLMSAILSDFTDPGELVLDPYAGTGATLLAAKNLGRRAVGIEINPEYCRAAVERLAQGVLV